MRQFVATAAGVDPKVTIEAGVGTAGLLDDGLQRRVVLGATSDLHREIRLIIGDREQCCGLEGGSVPPRHATVAHERSPVAGRATAPSVIVPSRPTRSESSAAGHCG